MKTPRPTSPSSFVEVTLFIGNLPFDLEGEELRDLLMSKGMRVSVVKIPKTSEGQSKGFGFATILTEDPGAEVMALYGTIIDGRPVRVDLSKESREALGR